MYSKSSNSPKTSWCKREYSSKNSMEPNNKWHIINYRFFLILLGLGAIQTFGSFIVYKTSLQWNQIFSVLKLFLNIYFYLFIDTFCIFYIYSHYMSCSWRLWPNVFYYMLIHLQLGITINIWIQKKNME